MLNSLEIRGLDNCIKEQLLFASRILLADLANTDHNCIHEEIKGRLNSGNACYHSVQSLLSSRLLSRNVKVKIYKTSCFVWV
jgi:hypothetical protein